MNGIGPCDRDKFNGYGEVEEVVECFGLNSDFWNVLNCGNYILLNIKEM